MSTKANYFKLGLFILAGLALGAAALIAFGLGKAFQRKVILETYLNESVQGLDVGSKVKFRGVSIGQVSHITFTSLKYELNKPAAQRRHLVLVKMDIERDQFAAETQANFGELLQNEIRRGLRIRLASHGITGLAYMEMDYMDPDKNPPQTVSWEPSNYYVPSAPSTVVRFINAAESVFDKLYRIDLEALATNLNQTIVETRAKIQNVDVTTLTSNANQFLAEVKQTAQDLQQALRDLRLDAVSTNLVGTLERAQRLLDSGQIDQAIAQLEQTLQRVDRLVAGSEQNLVQAIDHLRALTESLRELVENAKRFPSQVLFGSPPNPAKTHETKPPTKLLPSR